MTTQPAWTRVILYTALAQLPLALGVGCDDVSNEASSDVTRRAAAERAEAAEPAAEAPESTAQPARVGEPKPSEQRAAPPSDAPPSDAPPSDASAPDAPDDPIAFAKAHEGRRAPEVPASLACPEGTEERRGETGIFCRKREGYSIFHGPYIGLSRTGGVQREAERQPAHVHELVNAASDLEHAGDLSQARETYERAVQVAEMLENADLLVHTLALAGRGQLFAGSPDAALASHTRALELIGSCSISAAVRGTAHAQRGIYLQAMQRLDEAEVACHQACDARREAFGDEHPEVVKSMISMVTIAQLRGRSPSEVEPLTARAIDMACACLPKTVLGSAEWAELVDGLIVLLVGRASVRWTSGATHEVLPPLSLALDHAEAQRQQGHAPSVHQLQRIHQLVDALRQAAATAEAAHACDLTLDRTEALLFPGPPQERPVRMVFHRLRGFLHELRLAGVEDAWMVSALHQVLRNQPLSAELTQYPVFVDLRALISAAVAREPSMLTMAAMSVDLAGLPGQLERSLFDFEELVVPVLCPA